ncbi:MAG: hypothetical protein ACOC9V_00050 [Chloroflexota bacterium]
MFDAVIKVGGSVIAGSALKEIAPQWATLARSYRLLFLPGGGVFADQVRLIDRHFNLTDHAAHWMAIAAMDQCGYLLADCLPGARAVHDLRAAAAVTAQGRAAVLIPSRLLREHDPLPHSWEVTSDSLAAWLARFARAPLLALLKDVAGVFPPQEPVGSTPPIPEISRAQLERCAVVDSYFVTALPEQIECWIIDGRHPRRLAQLLATGETIGTCIARHDRAAARQSEPGARCESYEGRRLV